MIDVAISSWSLHTLFLDPEITGWRAVDFPRIARGYYGVRHLEYFEGDYSPTSSKRTSMMTDMPRRFARPANARG